MAEEITGKYLGIAIIGGIATCMMAFTLPVYFWVGGILVGTGVFVWDCIDSKYERFFRSIGLKNQYGEYPLVQEVRNKPYGKLIRFNVPAGICTADFEKCKQELQEYFNANVEISYSNKNIFLKLTTALQDKYDFAPAPCNQYECILGVGEGGITKIDLRNGHVLVCGATGWGKSTLERGILTNMIMHNQNIIINLVDFKRNELGIFKRCKVVNRFCDNEESFEVLLDELEVIAKQRYELFEKENVLDITGYNKKHNMKPIITIVDEFAQVHGNKSIMDKLKRRLSYDRAAGLYYIICTQRPSVDIIDGSIKANADTRICFKVADGTNAKVVLDKQETAELLQVRGRAYLRYAGKLEQFQAYWLDVKTAINYVKHTFVPEQKEMEKPIGVIEFDNRKRQKGLVSNRKVQGM